MKKCTVLGLVSAVVMLVAHAAFAQGVADGSTNPYHVMGEKLDSGLGGMTVADIAAYADPYHVAGESRDSGLGELTLADMAIYTGNRVAGESIDSGLGELTAADLRPYMDPYHVAGEKLDSGLGELTARPARGKFASAF